MKPLASNFFRKLLFLAFALALIQGPSPFAQNLKTWIGQGTGGAGTVFNTGTNWSPAGTPTTTDSCVMILTSGATITVSGNISVYALHCEITSATPQVFRLDAVDKSLTVLNDLFGTASGDPATHMEFSVGAGTPGGKIQVNGPALLGTTGTSPTITRGTGTNSQFVFLGDVTFGASSLTSGSSFPSFYIFDGAGAQTFTVNSASVALSSVTIGSTNSPTVTLAGSSNASLSSSAATANLTIGTNSTLDLGTNTLNRSSAGGSFSLGSGGTLKLGANIGGQSGSNFPINYTTVTLDPASTVEYNAPGGTNQTIYSTPAYAYLTISNSSGLSTTTKTAGGVLTVGKDLVTDTGSVFDCSSFAHVVKGNIVSNGSHAGSGKVVLQLGSSQHQISGTGSYRNLELNDALGAALGSNTIINGALTLTNGTFAVGADSLTLNGQVTATSGTMTSGVTGLIVYNQNSNNQNVLAANYGNLSFNKFKKVLAFNGTIGVAGTFSPDTNSTHTITGSTIEFNGSGAQTIPAFKYNNLTSSNTGARTLASSGTIGIATAFAPGTNSYTIAGSTIEYNGTSPQNLPAGFLTYYNLYISNSLQVTGITGLVVTNLLEVKTGTFNSSSTFNNVQIDTLARLSTPPGDTLKINGNWLNRGTYSSNNSTVRFQGSTQDTIFGSSSNTFDNLIISNSSGSDLIMNANCTVNATLTLLTVNVNTGTKVLTLGSGANVVRTSGYIIGNYRKTYSAAGSKTFEVGTANGYSPVTVNATSGTGTFTVKAVQGARPAAIDTNVLQRYWTLSSSGVAQANLTFSYLAGDVVGTEANYLLSTFSGGWAVVGGSVNTVLHQASISGATTFADWTLGEPSSFLGLSISNIDVSEGNSGTVSADFTVNLSGTSSQSVTVNFATEDSTALISDNDYVANTDVLTINPGETSGTISVLLDGDMKYEPNEIFKLNLAGPANAALLNNLALCTIQNDDSMPVVTISDFAGVEGAAGDSSQFNFHISLSNPSYQSVGFNFQTQNQTAKADTDYRAKSGIVTINPNDTSATISVTVLGDLQAEPNDTFRVKLTNPSGATFGDSIAIGVIINDDGATLTIGDVVDYEGNSGIKSFIFPLQLSNPLPNTVTVNFSTDSSEGSATGGVDFNRKNGIATILPGQLTANITVDVRGDTIDEPDETFNVFIWNSVNATIVHNTGTGTILNNDLSISIVDSTAQKLEGNSGTTPFTFTVRLNKVSAHPVSVRFLTADSNATVADNDYKDSTNVLTFAPGITSKSVVINVTGDTKDENHERFFFNLDNVSNAIIADSQGAGIIYNDDSKITINDVSAAEGDSGQTNFTFAVSLTSPATTQAKVWSRLIDNTALGDSDFVRKQDTVIFNPGELTKFITEKVKGDTTFESDETFFVKLTRLAGTTLPFADTQGTGTIQNDDARIVVSKYYDQNHNGVLDGGEQPMPGTTFKLKSLTRGFTLSGTTDVNGQTSFGKIGLDSYRLTEVLDTNYSNSLPDSGAYVYTVHAGDDIQSLWLNSAAYAAQAFRTGRYEDWAKATNAKGKQKGVPRVPDKVEAKLYLVAPQTALSLKLHFTIPFTGKVYNDTLKTTLIDSVVKSKDKTITLPIPIAHIYYIEGFGSKGAPIAVTASWEVSSNVFVPQPIYLQDQFKLRELRLPMPNLHNVGEELFAGASAPFATGMLVGVPQGAKKGNSVLHGKYADVLKSMSYKGTLHDNAVLRCIDKFDGKLTPISKQQKSLPPNKQNNKLFAELMTFELSLAASKASLFPYGLGGLMYMDTADISNPLNGLTLDRIAAIGDTLVSCETDITSIPLPTFGQLYSVIRKIDTTFSGPVDTLNFSIATRLKGVRLLRNVPFLFAQPGSMQPKNQLMPAVTENVPLMYRLDQNYPNPFNPTTTIQFQLREPARVTLRIYNALGQEVTRLLDHMDLDEGDQEVEFDGGGLASGVYFYRLEIASLETNATIYYQTKKMLLVK